MALAQQSGVSMTITELQRTGAGSLVATPLVFQWTGLTHSSVQGILNFKLQAKIARKEMPGSNDVVHHALAATWQPFPFSGEWDDKWMGQGQAFQTYLDFARLVQRIPLVRVTVDSLSFVSRDQWVAMSSASSLISFQ